MKVNDVIIHPPLFLTPLPKNGILIKSPPIHPRIGYTLNWYGALAFLRLSPSELLCSRCLPSDVFIFNWGVITPVCIAPRLGRRGGKKNTWERGRRRRRCLHPSWRMTAGAPAVPAGLWWLQEDPSQPPFCLFCNKMGCYSLLLRKKKTEREREKKRKKKSHPRPSAEDCGISMYWRLAGGSYTFVILCSGLQREWMNEGPLC